MQISDMFQQFNLNNNGTSIQNVNTASGVERINAALQQLEVGNVFEGTINEMKNGEIVLGLLNGQTVSAKLQGNVSLNLGESMFFQVKANSDSLIEIRPFLGGNTSNPTLLNALSAAGLSVNDTMLTMVDKMMEEQMPIDKNSLLGMARVIGANEGVSVSTLVEMTKFKLPVTAENIMQYENYKADQGAITEQLKSLVEGLPEQIADGGLSGKDAIALNNQIVSILDGNEITAGIQTAEDGAVIEKGNVDSNGTANDAAKMEAAEQSEVRVQVETVEQSETGTQHGRTEQADRMMQQGSNVADGMNGEVKIASGNVSSTGTLSSEQMQKLQDDLQKVGLLSEDGALSKNGVLNQELSPKELLQELNKAFLAMPEENKEAVKHLFAGKEYKLLLKNVLEEQWTIRPADLRDEHKVNDFYSRMDKQMSQLQEIMHNSSQNNGGSNSNLLAQTASDVQSNINFMNTLNQTYAYVQIPLKFSNQNAQGDLYVYTNKEHLNTKDGELSAFLHLDMDHLGSTDVSVKMIGKSVDTKFYLADDAAYHLILDHSFLLQKRLEEKGYNCKIEVENEEKNVHFVDDFLKKDDSNTGIVHRYSFDVRA